VREPPEHREEPIERREGVDHVGLRDVAPGLGDEEGGADLGPVMLHSPQEDPLAGVPSSFLCPTPPERLVDSAGRPYFLWDTENIDLSGLRDRLADRDAAVRAYWMAKVLRQAKPDDALNLMSWGDIDASWPDIQPHLGRSRAFWGWFLQAWRRAQHERR
jgi:hypothetical protein